MIKRALATLGKELPFTEQAAPPCLTGGRKAVEKLWSEFFSDPSQWWDHRQGKVNPRYPDFKHKKRDVSLWLNGKLNPPWVREELSALPPGILVASLFSWNYRLAKHVKSGQYEKTLELFKQIQEADINPDGFTFVPVLNACAYLRDLEQGRSIHRQIVQSCLELDTYVASSLIDMYAKCGSIEDAQSVFNKMATRNVVTWNAMILGLAKCGQGHKALDLFRQMQHEGVEPDHGSFVGMLNACASVEELEVGRAVHKQIIEGGWESDVIVASCLIDMYIKCGCIEDAWKVFSKMPSRNLVAWSTMILGYVKCGEGEKALELFTQMRRQGLEPDTVTFVGILNACASLKALEEGRRIHEEIILRGCKSDVTVCNSLIDMYIKCGSIAEARKVFNKMITRDVVAWSSMMWGYVKCRQGQNALDLFPQMQQEGVHPNLITFLGLLNACAQVVALEEGRRVHAHIIQSGYESDVSAGTSLIDMYAKCGCIEDAQTVFDEMPMHNVVSWNAIIFGYVNCRQGQKALQLFQQMQQQGVEPNPVTFVAVLNACASVEAIEQGRAIHEAIIQRGYESDAFVSSALVDMYAKCGSLEGALEAFQRTGTRNVAAWSSLILAYVRFGQGQTALDLFEQMQREGVEPNPVTFVAVLNACSSLGALGEGRCVHDQIIKQGYELNLFVGNSLIDMYMKCGSIEDGCRVFSKMSVRNVATWTAMILGYVECGEGKKALKLSQRMQMKGVEPDLRGFVAVLKACGSVAALEEGRRAHEQIIQRGYEFDVFVASALIDMYAKCGSIEDSQRVFNKIDSHDWVLWNAMLGGYAMHGHAMDTLVHFQRMCQIGLEINGVTFVSLLSACSHSGLVDEGLDYFETLNSAYSTCLALEHLTCMVDLLGRAGRLHEAEDVIKTMSLEPNASTWMPLLGACRVHGNLEMGEHAARRVFKLSPGRAAGHILLSNIYAAEGDWESKDLAQRLRLDSAGGTGLKMHDDSEDKDILN